MSLPSPNSHHQGHDAGTRAEFGAAKAAKYRAFHDYWDGRCGYGAATAAAAPSSSFSPRGGPPGKRLPAGGAAGRELVRPSTQTRRLFGKSNASARAHSGAAARDEESSIFGSEEEAGGGVPCCITVALESLRRKPPLRQVLRRTMQLWLGPAATSADISTAVELTVLKEGDNPDFDE